MTFSGEGVVTERNNGLGSAEDWADRKPDRDDRGRITRNVTLEQMISGSDLSTHWSRVGNVPY